MLPSSLSLPPRGLWSRGPRGSGGATGGTSPSTTVSDLDYQLICIDSVFLYGVLPQWGWLVCFIIQCGLCVNFPLTGAILSDLLPPMRQARYRKTYIMYILWFRIYSVCSLHITTSSASICQYMYMHMHLLHCNCECRFDSYSHTYTCVTKKAHYSVV